MFALLHSLGMFIIDLFKSPCRRRRHSRTAPAPHGQVRPAGGCTKSLYFEKKPSLSGTLCAKPPARACSIPVRASQSILRAVVSDARTSDFKHAPVGGYGEPSHPVELTMRLDRGGMGFNKRRIAREGARSSRSGTFRAFFNMHRTAVDRRKSDFQSESIPLADLQCLIG